MGNQREAYEKMFDAQLNERAAEIELFKAKALTTKAEEKVAYYKTIEALQLKKNDTSAKLRELKNSGDEAWEDFKAGAERAWDDLMMAYNDARSRFK